MKLTSILILVLSLQTMATSLWSQSPGVTFKAEQTTLHELFNTIENETGYRFFYNNDEVNVSQKVSVDVADKPVGEVLTEAFSGLPYTFRESGNKLIIVEHKEMTIETPAPPPVEPVKKITVTGQVSDTKGEFLLGVTVVEKGTTNGVITNANGEFQLLNVAQDATLVFSFLGLKTQEVKVSGKSRIVLVMQEESVDLEEVVTIGYGKVKKLDYTGSIGVIKSDKLDPLVNTQAALALQGKVAGLTVALNEGGGTPGWGNSIVVRGIGSINDVQPLILLDNMPISDMNNINPEDMESIQVLKDASAAAIYGSRAANGVILITTKQGAKGKIRITANVDIGIQQINRKLDVCTTDQWLTVMDALYKATSGALEDANNDGVLNYKDPTYSGYHLPDIALNPQVTGKGTDWQNEMYGSAPVKNYAFSLSGGSDNLTYNVSANYMDQDGITIGNNFKRFVTRASSTYTKGRFKLGQTVMATNTNSHDGNGRAINAIAMIPAYQVYNSDYVGGYQPIDADVALASTEGVYNPVALKNMERDNRKNTNIDLNFFGEVTLLDGLVFKSNYTDSRKHYEKIYHQSAYTPGGTSSAKPNKVELVTSSTYFWQLENTLSYNKVFAEKHSVNAVIGQTSSRNTESTITIDGEGMADGIWELTDGSTTNKVMNTTTYASTLASYLGRLNYSYDNRYLLTGSFRRDGSSKFYKTNRWGNFSALAAGWNIANEQFFKNLNTPVSVLKLRCSWGVLGNANIDDYQYFRNMSSGEYIYDTGSTSTVWSGTIESSIANTDIKWEKTTSKNLGLDLEMWNGKLVYTMDIYDKITTDMLMELDGSGLPPSVGTSGNSIWVNTGNVSNKGVEMTLTYKGKIRDFNYSVTGIYTHLTNKVVELSDEKPSISQGAGPDDVTVSYTKEGYPVYGFFLVQTDGLFRSQAEIDAYTKDGTKIQPNAQVGDQKFKDANGDGEIDDNDRVYCGSAFPAHEFSLRLDGQWKGFDAQLFFQGLAGSKVYNFSRAMIESGDYTTNFSTALLNSYTFNSKSDIPRLDISDLNKNGMSYSDRWLEDGSYLRLKTVELGYTLPSAMMKKLSIERCRFYVAADNVFTLTNYTGFSPDVSKTGSYSGIDRTWSPAIKSYHVGLQLNF